MTDTHVIRLRGPWEYEPLARVAIAADGTRRESRDDLPPPGRVHLPADWGQTLGADFHGRVRYTRRFGRPTNLEPHEQVWLVIEGVDYFSTVALNAAPLGEIVGYQTPWQFDVTPLLADRNLLTLEVELPEFESDSKTLAEPVARGQSAAEIRRPGREDLPGGPIGEVRLEVRS